MDVALGHLNWRSKGTRARTRIQVLQHGIEHRNASNNASNAHSALKAAAANKLIGLRTRRAWLATCVCVSSAVALAPRAAEAPRWHNRGPHVRSAAGAALSGGIAAGLNEGAPASCRPQVGAERSIIVMPAPCALSSLPAVVTRWPSRRGAVACAPRPRAHSPGFVRAQAVRQTASALSVNAGGPSPAVHGAHAGGTTSRSQRTWFAFESAV